MHHIVKQISCSRWIIVFNDGTRNAGAAAQFYFTNHLPFCCILYYLDVELGRDNGISIWSIDSRFFFFQNYHRRLRIYICIHTEGFSIRSRKTRTNSASSMFHSLALLFIIIIFCKRKNQKKRVFFLCLRLGRPSSLSWEMAVSETKETTKERDVQRNDDVPPHTCFSLPTRLFETKNLPSKNILTKNIRC